MNLSPVPTNVCFAPKATNQGVPRALAARDALSAEFKELYPAFETRLADPMSRIEGSDREIVRINTRDKSAGAPEPKRSRAD